MALHERPGATDEWYTPPYVFDAMAMTFTTDVASPGEAVVPWVPAREHITSGSLSREWRGFIWMNPPFGGRNALEPWLSKMFHHGNGVALVPDRTSAPWWQEYAPQAASVLFVAPKIRFLRPDGTAGVSPAQGTTLLAFGNQGRMALRNARRAGLGVLMEPSEAPSPVPGAPGPLR